MASRGSATPRSDPPASPWAAFSLALVEPGHTRYGAQAKLACTMPAVVRDGAFGLDPARLSTNVADTREKTPMSFAGLFGGRNPLQGLMKHMPVAHECAQQVAPLMDALTKEDREGLKVVAKKIFDLEEQCDQVKHQVRASLPKSLFLPVDRRDVLEVLHFQDSIADTAQDIAGLLLERNMSVPEHMADPLQLFVERCIDVVTLAAEIVASFDGLLEAGFKGPEVEEMEGKINRLNEAEDGTDDLGLSLTRSLFAHEDEMKPVSVMMWYQLIEWIGDLADHAEKVANRVRLLIAR